eukprot:698239-Rhodomonas_salina.1
MQCRRGRGGERLRGCGVEEEERDHEGAASKRRGKTARCCVEEEGRDRWGAASKRRRRTARMQRRGGGGEPQGCGVEEGENGSY